ncbi:DUF4351 domain-containing protein [Acaryochloris sp. IP29b_bin.148]|uniref:DUF4351 domain-containing protein n=1 Tax=Acaryochloris sp. IP29b_bin.148 TaxID=2969218 RepID=UPI00262A155A|nr:DUF4351 domain-containing protein [Acaryochloris sp. IP29b_bin.148]
MKVRTTHLVYGWKNVSGAVSRLASLSLSELEDLSEALLDFTSWADLQDWLERR